MIDVQQRGLVSICRMTHGKATALDVELCGAFTAQLEAHRHAPTHALALIGHGEIFSPRSISCASCRGSRRAVPGQLASSGRVEPRYLDLSRYRLLLPIQYPIPCRMRVGAPPTCGSKRRKSIE